MIVLVSIWWWVSWGCICWLRTLYKRDNSTALWHLSMGVIGMVCISLVLLKPATSYQLCLASMVFLWAFRLAVHSVLLNKFYSMYEQVLSERLSILHGQWGRALESLRLLGIFMPLFAIFYQGANMPVGSVLVYVSAVLWLFGFILQTTSDMALYSFKMSHPRARLTSGVWSLCRHPNYLGDIMVSWGFWGLSACVSSQEYALISMLLSPVLSMIYYAYKSKTNVHHISSSNSSQPDGMFGILPSYQTIMMVYVSFSQRFVRY